MYVLQGPLLLQKYKTTRYKSVTSSSSCRLTLFKFMQIWTTELSWGMYQYQHNETQYPTLFPALANFEHSDPGLCVDYCLLMEAWRWTLFEQMLSEWVRIQGLYFLSWSGATGHCSFTRDLLSASGISPVQTSSHSPNASPMSKRSGF